MMGTGEEVEAASRRFKKALIERARGAELSHRLGCCALRRRAHHWRAALNQFAIVYEDRFLKGPA
jgi:hypothetical protein